MNEQLIRNLYSTNQQTAIAAIEELGHSGNSSYLPMLIDLLKNNANSEIGNRITTLLCDLKHPESVKFLTEAISNPKNLTIRETLVRACWENGLDYTPYFNMFIDLLANSDYMTAFEAFTVIENSEGKIADALGQEYLQKLRAALPNATDDRKVLLHRIIQFLPSLINNEESE